MLWTIIIFLIIALGLLITGHLLVYKTLAEFLNLQGKNLAYLKYLLLTLSPAFILFSVLANRWSNKLFDYLYTILASWMGFLYFFLAASVLFWVLFAAFKVFNLYFPSLIFGTVIFTCAVILGAFSIWNSSQIKITEYSVNIQNLNEAWKGKKIVLISDVHLGNIWGENHAKKIVKAVNKQQPQMVIIAGDYYDGPLADYVKLAAPLKEVNAPDGIFFSTGNHEEFRDSKQYTDALASAGVKVLKNEFKNVNGLQIVGVNYGDSTKGLLSSVLKQIPFERNKPGILIMHAPIQQQAALDDGINLMVSGHTHKGQIWPAGLITNQIYKGFDYGMHNFGKLINITSSGAGTWGPPLRLLTNSEIVVITLN